MQMKFSIIDLKNCSAKSQFGCAFISANQTAKSKDAAQDLSTMQHSIKKCLFSSLRLRTG
jgi:hypothetical protein